MGNSVRVLATALLSAGLLSGCGSGDAPGKTFEYAQKGAYSAEISPTGKFTVLGSFNHGGSLWNNLQQERLYNWNHANGEYTIIAATAFAPDETYAATANQQDLVLWSLQDGRPAGFWRSPAEILGMDLSPNGDYALLGLADHTAVYFDIKNGGVKRTLGHQARVKAVDLSEDAQFALTGSDAWKTKFWNVETSELLHTIELGNVVDTVALAPNNEKAFSSASLDDAIIWNTKTGKVIHTLTDNRDLFARRVTYTAAEFSPDSQRLLTGTNSGKVQLWNVATGEQLREWAVEKRDAYGPNSTAVYAVGFGQGKYYAMGSNGIFNELK